MSSPLEGGPFAGVVIAILQAKATEDWANLPFPRSYIDNVVHTPVFCTMSFFLAGSSASGGRQIDDLSYIRYREGKGKPTVDR